MSSVSPLTEHAAAEAAIALFEGGQVDELLNVLR